MSEWDHEGGRPLNPNILKMWEDLGQCVHPSCHYKICHQQNKCIYPDAKKDSCSVIIDVEKKK